jgi:hypothetical protein
MKKLISILLAVLVVVMISAVGVFAQDQNPNASAKATAQIKGLTVISASEAVQPDDEAVDTWVYDLDTNPEGWHVILTQTIKTANDKDLFIDASLLSGLYTGTLVRSKGGDKEASAAAGAVLSAVTVDYDGAEPASEWLAWPGPIVYNARAQVLTATLQGIVDLDEFGEIVIIEPEEIGLFIATMSANSFNWIVDDLDSGMHTVEVWAKCVTYAGTSKGSAEAVAAIGLGSVTIEEVRMVKGENAIVDL